MSALPAAQTAHQLGTRRRVRPTALLAVELRDELLGIAREPAALFFSVLMPVAFFWLFVSLFGGESSGLGGLPVGTTMLATFGTYGVVGATMMTPGIGLADARERGWLRVLKVSPTPVPLTLTAKVLATLPFALGILSSMTVAAALLGVLQISLTSWLALAGVLAVGTVPFALVGLAVGALASPNATTAVLNAMLIPMAIASGLWFPLEIMPAWVRSLAPLLPTYHLSQLGLGVLADSSGWLGHLAALLAFAALAGVAAALAYRRSRA